MSNFAYVGEELEIFAHARNWKAYFHSQLRPFLTGDVLEVGAGLGGTTTALCDGTQNRWIALEPDPTLARQIPDSIGDTPIDVRTATIADLPDNERFDAILYIDVLEHIEDDRGELARAAKHLKPHGSLIVLAPAHQFLFSPFDKALGHFRRYNRRQMAAIAPSGLTLVRLRYLDSVGMFLSLGNRFCLRQSQPTPRQIQFWDRVCVPCSRLVDWMLVYRLGKSIIAVWQKP